MVPNEPTMTEEDQEALEGYEKDEGYESVQESIDNTEEVDDPSTVLVPQTDMNALLDKLTELEDTVADLNRRQTGRLAPRIDQLRRTVSRDEAEEFLSSPRPKSEFWSWNPWFFKLLFPGGERVDAHGIKQRLPALIMQFVEWRGAGSEFPNPNNNKHVQRQMLIGRSQLHLEPLITVTEEDMERFDIPATGANRPHDGVSYQAPEGGLQPLYPLEKVIARITTDIELGDVFMTGEHFQAVLQTLYETRWFDQERQQALQIKLAALKPGAEKTGRVEGLEGMGL